MINWKYDLLLAVSLFAIGLAFYITGSAYPATPFLFPSYLTVSLCILSVILGISAIRRSKEDVSSSKIEWHKYKAPAFVVALMAAYIGVMDYIGFLASGCLLLATFYIGMGFKNKILGIILAIVITAIVYAIFHIALEVSLPIGSLWETE
ncbi:tripartite tricarboxylate transporter TctB family protein [Desulfovibrio litoralis]|uniref:Tripartite tricarboxylate transporter TctB family protein n=1 Tax=Desulfovibrio litoralis DSM 11393 TaxID=1121455 RepID=A0A1M7SGP1_9BACT|nr:tripartite tricarboxylate transporter TctB family protein [Desulfovibrio litoralis]SHN57646.1 Tripartite tricarboxylate transporter TctB family protein [Desulfovibrio litoralis DSM 11393]